MISALTSAVCLVAAIATFSMQSMAVRNYNPGSWETIMLLGTWDAAIYVALASWAFGARQSTCASLIALFATTVISLSSVLILHNHLKVYMTPPAPGLRAQNSFGPIVELGLPLLQWPLFGLCLWLARHKE